METKFKEVVGDIECKTLTSEVSLSLEVVGNDNNVIPIEVVVDVESKFTLEGWEIEYVIPNDIYVTKNPFTGKRMNPEESETFIKGIDPTIIESIKSMCTSEILKLPNTKFSPPSESFNNIRHIKDMKEKLQKIYDMVDELEVDDDYEVSVENCGYSDNKTFSVEISNFTILGTEDLQESISDLIDYYNDLENYEKNELERDEIERNGE